MSKPTGNPVGRPSDLVRAAWRMRFGISDRVGPNDGWTDSFSAQLSFCKSDVERRLILGISEKYTQDERDALIVR